MAKTNTKSKKGFTIIEVVLVLAIAGLIFLMVFVAFPALQRNQRDTQRRQDYAQLSSAIISYATNNNGKLPANNATLDAKKFVNTNGTSPDGTPYWVTVKENVDANATPGIAADANDNNVKKTQVFIHTKANCNGTRDNASAPKKDGNAKHFAIYGYLESGTYCYAGSI